MSIITNQDYLNALYGYKRIHCPKLTGLSKQQLGQLARKMGLDVIPSGSKIRPDGLGTGKHKYKQRLPTTWRGTAQQRELERNRAFNEYFDRRVRGDMRAERLEKTKRRDDELERVKREREAMVKEDKDAPTKQKKKKIKPKKPEPEPEPEPKPKPKPKRKLPDTYEKLVELLVNVWGEYWVKNRNNKSLVGSTKKAKQFILLEFTKLNMLHNRGKIPERDYNRIASDLNLQQRREELLLYMDMRLGTEEFQDIIIEILEKFE